MLITSHQEGLGIVGLEALLHGTPVIATLCGGPEDFIIQGRNGYLVPIDDVQAMADKALELLSNHALLCQLSLAARDFIHAQYSLQTIHEIFKQGLSTTYPELKELFATVDEEQSIPLQKQPLQPQHRI
jgi:glycosyltransferase involved in cell wall biosynthesis